MSGFRAPRGTNDWFGEVGDRRRRAVDLARRVAEHAGYRQIVTPTFEDSRIYARTSGEESDVVKKEMYTFTDRGGRSLTLRPEGTAGVMRAFLEHMTRMPRPVKLWYCAPMFRYAAVQRGRFREHYQFGVEAIGSPEPSVDAEVIALQAAWYDACRVGGLSLNLNSIGDAVCRPAYVRLLTAFLDEHLDELCAECRERRHTNPLRVLDCKQASCRAVLAAAPRITDHLCEPCAEHFAAVRVFLDARDVAYVLDHTLVRGLDYYTRTAWEFLAGDLAVGGGGRYDGLAEQLGGAATPGVGFGSGVERLLEVAGPLAPPPAARRVLFAVVHEPALPRLHALMDEARRAGVTADAAHGARRLRRALEVAGRAGATHTVIVGDEEWGRDEAAIRDMNTGEQRAVPLDRLVEELTR